MKSRFFTLCLLLLWHTGHAQTVQPGDLVFTGINCKDPDQFSVMVLQTIPPNTIIYFTDCGWDPVNGFRAGEGLVMYQTPASGLLAGTSLTFPDDPGFTTQGVSGFFGLSTDGEQLYCFTGSMSQPYFICALNLDGNNWAGTATSNQTGAAPALVSYLCPAIPEADNAVWNCDLPNTSTGNIALLTGDPAQWTYSNTRQVLPPLCSIALGLDPVSFPNTSETEPMQQLFIQKEGRIQSFILKETPVMLNVYSLEGRLIAHPLLIKENLHLYTTDIPEMNFSVCILEIISATHVFRTLIHF